MQTTQRTLSEHAPDPEAYAAKYAELKAKNVRELDRFLMVAAKILTGARCAPLCAPRRAAAIMRPELARRAAACAPRALPLPAAAPAARSARAVVRDAGADSRRFPALPQTRT